MNVNFEGRYQGGSNRRLPYNVADSIISLSPHAIQRFRERTMLQTICAMETFVREAMQRGNTVDAYCYGSACRRYMENKIEQNSCWPIAYQGMLILFSQNRKKVVTVYGLPLWFFDAEDVIYAESSGAESISLSKLDRFVEHLRKVFGRNKYKEDAYNEDECEI